MNVLIIIFMVVAIVFALASIGYVSVDVVLEVRSEILKRKEKENEPAPTPVVVVAPAEPEPEPEPEEMPEIVEHIEAEEADLMISDNLAMKTAIYESGAGRGQQGIINVGVLNERFEADDVVTIAALKEKGLIPKRVGRVKILAHGSLDKPLTVKAEGYSIQAIKMIELTGGTVIILKD